MMRKTITTAFLLFSLGLFAQTYSTGVVTLTTDMTVKLDTNPTTVTMTLTGPSDKWFALGFGPSVAAGFAMSAGDVVVYTTSLSDRKYVGQTAPSVDATQDWTTVSDNVSGTTRTIVATRALNTGDANDIAITNDNASINFAWARPSTVTTTLAYHGFTNKGFAVASRTLSTDSFETSGYKLFPNPSSDFVQIELPQSVTTVAVEIYDVQGKKALSGTVNSNEKLNISSLNSGNYVIKASTSTGWATSKLIVE